MAPKLTLISSSNTLSQSTGSPIASALAAAKSLSLLSRIQRATSARASASAHKHISSFTPLPILAACDSCASSILPKVVCDTASSVSGSGIDMTRGPLTRKNLRPIPLRSYRTFVLPTIGRADQSPLVRYRTNHLSSSSWACFAVQTTCQREKVGCRDSGSMHQVMRFRSRTTYQSFSLSPVCVFPHTKQVGGFRG